MQKLKEARKSEWSHKCHGGLFYFEPHLYGINLKLITIVTSNIGSNTAKLIVAEWDAVVSNFTRLTSHFNYGTAYWKWLSNWVALHRKLQRIVILLTIGTFHLQFKYVNADSSYVWCPGISLCIILDASHRKKRIGTPIGQFRKANGTIVAMDSPDYSMHMAPYT